MKLRRLQNSPAEFFIHCIPFSPFNYTQEDYSLYLNTQLYSLKFNDCAQIELHIHFFSAMGGEKFSVTLIRVLWLSNTKKTLCLSASAVSSFDYAQEDIRLRSGGHSTSSGGHSTSLRRIALYFKHIVTLVRVERLNAD